MSRSYEKRPNRDPVYSAHQIIRLISFLKDYAARLPASVMVGKIPAKSIFGFLLSILYSEVFTSPYFT